MCLTVQAGTVVMGTSFPTPYEAVVDKTKGLSVRVLHWADVLHVLHDTMRSCDGTLNIWVFV